MDKGYIKLFRKITKWQWYTHETTFRVFIHLLFKANWEDKIVNGIHLKRGQVITNWREIATELEILDKNKKPARQPIRTALKNLKSTNDITTKKLNKGTIITINNYNNYQDITNKTTNKKIETNHQPNHQPNQPINKEEKEEKNIYIYIIPTEQEVINYLQGYNLANIQKTALEFIEFCKKYGHKLGHEWHDLLRYWVNYNKRLGTLETLEKKNGL